MSEGSLMPQSPYSRRELLRGGVLLGGALLASPLLAACSGDAGSSPTGPSRRGGTLRAALVGTGANENLNPFTGATVLDFVRARAVHGTLGVIDPDAPEDVRYGVLAGIDVDDDRSRYSLRVRGDARFTDGSPVTARDVLYSLKFVVRSTPSYAGYTADFDLDAARVDGQKTLVVPTKRPVSDGHLMLCQGIVFVFKDGTRRFTPDTPSCGAFRIEEFDPGEGTLLRRNDDYVGGTGGPYLDAVELRSIVADDARANALRGGQVDFVHDLAPAHARTVEADDQFTVVESRPPDVSGLGVLLNMSRPPFDDVRVRQACKLALDRKAILNTALLGRGIVGNDLFAPGYPDSPTAIPQRPHDPDRASRLLRAAGASGAKVTLTTAPESAGLVRTCTQIAEQLSALGLPVTIDERPAGGLYADYDAYARLQMAATYSTAMPPLQYYEVSRAGKNPFSLGWSRSDVDRRISHTRTLTGQRRHQASTAVHRVLWEEDNVLLPVFKPVLNGQVANLRGVADGLFLQFPSFVEASLQ
ncbi:MAG: ABC transporter substrate-binding protein [Pseudonocardiaceae bacterium]|nr:ABC transporter substrate-binding protein [Pseudonocardiaceae bacterium]